MTTADIKLVIQAFYKVNNIERELHGEGDFMYILKQKVTGNRYSLSIPI